MRLPRHCYPRPVTRKLIIFASAGLAIVGLAATRPAFAYCRSTNCPPTKCPRDENGCPTGTPLVWPTSCVTFSMQIDASMQVDLATATRVTEKAFAAWANSACLDADGGPAIRIDHRFGNAACSLHEYNETDGNANIIVFRDDVWPYEDDVLGLTTISYKGGVIFDADIEVNATQILSIEDPVPPSGYDLQSILTHEAGHFLGLAHSNNGTATMRERYTSGTSLRDLTADDVAGICAVYPAGQAAQCDPTPRHGFSPFCGIFPSGGAGRCSLAGLESATHARHGWIGVLGAVCAIALMQRRALRFSARGEKYAQVQAMTAQRKGKRLEPGKHGSARDPRDMP